MVWSIPETFRNEVSLKIVDEGDWLLPLEVREEGERNIDAARRGRTVEFWSVIASFPFEELVWSEKPRQLKVRTGPGPSGRPMEVTFSLPTDLRRVAADKQAELGDREAQERLLSRPDSFFIPSYLANLVADHDLTWFAPRPRPASPALTLWRQVSTALNRTIEGATLVIYGMAVVAGMSLASRGVARGMAIRIWLNAHGVYHERPTKPATRFDEARGGGRSMEAHTRMWLVGVYFALIALACVLIPWRQCNARGLVCEYIGYGFLWSPPDARSSIDFPRIALTISGVTALFLGAYFLVHLGQSDSSRK